MKTSNYIFFDGECILCNKAALFIAKKDKKNKFLLVARNSKLGKQLLPISISEKYSNSVILLKNKNFYTKAQAITKIVLQLPYYKIIGFIFLFIPPVIINKIYDFLAKNRNKIFKNTSCLFPVTLQNKIIKE